MEINLKLRAREMCRTCFAVSSDLKPLTAQISDNKTLHEMLSYITNTNIEISEEIPQQICSYCEVILCQSECFKRSCIENEKTLKSWINCCNLVIKENKVIKNEANDRDRSEMKNNFLQLPYQCSICLLKYVSTSELQDHVCTQHNIRNNEIKSCDLKTDNDVPVEVKVEFIGKPSDSLSDDLRNEEDTGAKYKTEKQPSRNTMNKSDNDAVQICSYCNLKFTRKYSYKTHMREVHNLEIKGTKVKRKTNLNKKNNSTQNSNNTQIMCNKCNVTLKSIQALKIHLKKKHTKIQDMDMKTEYCSDSIDNDDENSTSIDKDIDTKRVVPTVLHQCSLCMRKFTKEESLILHIRKHKERDNEIFSCTICKREFKHRAHLDNHLQSVHITEDSKPLKNIIEVEFQGKKHICIVCSKSFNMLSTLKDHFRVHSGEKPYLCSTCGRGFSQKTNLKQHMRRHQGLKPYKCDTCDQQFVSKGELDAHKRKHTGAHPFICDTCNAGFTTSSSLVKHRRIHTGEKPFACEFCPMRFAASGTLKNHRRTHTGEKPYRCAHCDKAFVQRNDLVSHTRCHTGERPYVCTVCGQAFRQGSTLKTHMKMHNLKQTPLIVGT